MAGVKPNLPTVRTGALRRVLPATAMSLQGALQTFRKVHHLKCHPEYFEETWMGRKPFEVRLNDRDFQVGDLIHLREWIPQEERYTPREVAGAITYATTFGCQPGYVVLGVPKSSQVWWADQMPQTIKEVKP